MNMATLTFDINFCVQCRTKCETIRESPCSLVPRYFVSSPLFSSFSRIIFLFFVWFLKFPLRLCFRDGALRPYVALVKRFHFERYTFYKYPYLLDEEASRTLHIPCASWPVNVFRRSIRTQFTVMSLLLLSLRVTDANEQLPKKVFVHRDRALVLLDAWTN